MGRARARGDRSRRRRRSSSFAATRCWPCSTPRARRSARRSRSRHERWRARSWIPRSRLRSESDSTPGEAVPVNGGFRGGALNLAARLCSLADAGEVLATREVRASGAKGRGALVRRARERTCQRARCPGRGDRRPARARGPAQDLAFRRALGTGAVAGVWKSATRTRASGRSRRVTPPTSSGASD